MPFSVFGSFLFRLVVAVFILALNTVFIAVFVSFAHCVHLLGCVHFLKRSQQKGIDREDVEEYTGIS